MSIKGGDDTDRLICTAQACTNYCSQYCDDTKPKTIYVIGVDS
ncbi:MAG: hypothetical protein WBB45_02350 [Cyclobacteriaceae bacterium]